MIVNSPETTRNVTEWAKQQACWNRVTLLVLEWPEALEAELLSSAERTAEKRTAVRDQQMLNGIEAQNIVVQTEPGFWNDVKAWGVSQGLLSQDDTGILDVVNSIPAKIPSERQSLRGH